MPPANKVKQRLFFIAVVASVLFSGWAHYFTQSSGLMFISASIAVILLAGLLGKATENVAFYAGERMGGFLNATFGNAAELIIAIFLLKEGLHDMVKASITGSIIGNLLLVLGLSILAGGLRYKIQSFNSLLAAHNASLMILAVVALVIPAAFITQLGSSELEIISLIVAVTLMIAYFLWLIFSMITHKHELSDVELDEEGEEAIWGKRTSLFLLFTATAFVAVVSEWLVESIELVAHRLGWSELFVGSFLVAIIGNASEHSAAVFLAMKNRIGASVEIAVGSSLQIALFVAPLLVLISLLFNNPMNIIFSPAELLAIAIAVIIANSISRDGETNWFEGVLLLVVYLMLGTAFFLVG